MLSRIKKYLKTRRYFGVWKKTIKQHEFDLSTMGYQIDEAYRIYTVYDTEKFVTPEYQTIMEVDREKYDYAIITREVTRLRQFLDSVGLAELYAVYAYEPTKTGKYIFVVGFKEAKSHEWIKWHLWAQLGVFFTGILFLAYFLINWLSQSIF